MPDEPVEFNFAARSDIGLKRSSNQDSAYAGPHLLVLADGMGGAAGGDIASSVAVAHLAPLDLDYHQSDKMLEHLRQAFHEAHLELLDRSRSEPELTGLGTTCIAILRSGNKLAMAHIGDSRAYLLRGDTLTQVTTDHSYVQFLVTQGEITPEEAAEHPNRSAVTKVLGYDDVDANPDETVREAVVGDRWLLCSDGLSGLVSDSTIAEIMSEVSDPGQCAEELIELALRAGGTDNVTCVVADIAPSGMSTYHGPEIVGAAAIDRFSPSRGGGGASGRAAALSPDSAPTPQTPDEEASTGNASTRWWTPLLTLFFIALVVGAGWLGYAWTQTQYYVIGQDGRVVIHQGIPQSLGPWHLSHPIEVTDLLLEDLPSVDRQRLTEPVVRTSHEEINAYLDQLRAEINKNSSSPETPQSGAPPQSGTSAQSGSTPQSGAS